MLYDLCGEIDDFVNDPSDDALKSLWQRAIGYKIDIDLELDDTQRELDTDDGDDGQALASTGFGTDEDYGGSNERE